MRNKNLLTTAIATSLGVSFSAGASEILYDNALKLAASDENSNHSQHKDASIGYQSEGGIAGSGFCCADCRDINLND